MWNWIQAVGGWSFILWLYGFMSLLLYELVALGVLFFNSICACQRTLKNDSKLPIWTRVTYACRVKIQPGKFARRKEYFKKTWISVVQKGKI